MSELIWSDDAWADYLYWQAQDKRTLKRINLTDPCSRVLCGCIREEKSADAVSPMRSASDAAASDDDYDDKASALSSNLLIKDIERNGCSDGVGKPEALTGSLQGEFSRRINEKDRLVYHMEDGRIYIAHCRGHYSDK